MTLVFVFGLRTIILLYIVHVHIRMHAVESSTDTGRSVVDHKLHQHTHTRVQTNIFENRIACSHAIRNFRRRHSGRVRESEWGDRRRRQRCDHQRWKGDLQWVGCELECTFSTRHENVDARVTCMQMESLCGILWTCFVFVCVWMFDVVGIFKFVSGNRIFKSHVNGTQRTISVFETMGCVASNHCGLCVFVVAWWRRNYLEQCYGRAVKFEFVTKQTSKSILSISKWFMPDISN